MSSHKTRAGALHCFQHLLWLHGLHIKSPPLCPALELQRQIIENGCAQLQFSYKVLPTVLMRGAAFPLPRLQNGQTEAQRGTERVTWATQRLHHPQDYPRALLGSGILTLGNWKHFVETSGLEGGVEREEMGAGGPIAAAEKVLWIKQSQSREATSPGHRPESGGTRSHLGCAGTLSPELWPPYWDRSKFPRHPKDLLSLWAVQGEGSFFPVLGETLEKTLAKHQKPGTCS